MFCASNSRYTAVLPDYSYEEIPIPDTLQPGRTPRADDIQIANSKEPCCQWLQGNYSFLQNYELLRKCIYILFTNLDLCGNFGRQLSVSCQNTTGISWETCQNTSFCCYYCCLKHTPAFIWQNHPFYYLEGGMIPDICRSRISSYFTLFIVLTREQDFRFQNRTQTELGLCPEGNTVLLKILQNQMKY